MATYFSKLKNFSQQNSKTLLILSMIMLVGIFLRTWHFTELVRFNADQSRDAGVVSDFLSGKAPLPLLGPKAGGTEFKLGGAFYHLQIISAKIFGNSPDKMAYPDLISSILTIPLLYFLMRKAFKGQLALTLAAVLSVSIFAIKYAHFAWNPNSAPFYSLLLLNALLVLAQNKTAHRIWWAIVAGLALGIGVQLHTLLLVILPIVVLFFFLYFGKQNPKLWPQFVLIFCLAVFLNTTQIISEVHTKGANVRAFLMGATNKTAKENSVWSKFLNNANCQMQGNAFILTGLGDDDQCGTDLVINGYAKTKGLLNKLFWAVGMFLMIIFSLGGGWLWLRSLRVSNENDNRKFFLQLTGWYALVGFLILIPLANEISLRFYLALIFVPFVMLGLWLEYISQNILKNKYFTWLLVAVCAGLVIANATSLATALADYNGQSPTSGSTETEITLGETKAIATYLLNVAEPNSRIYLEGKQKYLFKYLKSIEYFTQVKGIEVRAFSKNLNPTGQEKVFLLNNAKNAGQLTKSLAEAFVIEKPIVAGRFSIQQLISK